MIEFYVLASGSKGNSTVIKINNDEAILIDSGLSFADFEKRLEETGISEKSIKYIFITHNHIDHIKSLAHWSFSKVYCLEKTLDLQGFNILEPYKEVSFDGFSVIPVKTSHDAPGSCGYVFTINNERLVYITDTGDLSLKTQKYLKNAEYYCFESNHDIKMQLGSSRPAELKERVMSSKGHLSNSLSAAFLDMFVGDKTKEIILAHISEECNSDECIYSTFGTLLGRNPEMEHITLLLARQWEVVKG